MENKRLNRWSILVAAIFINMCIGAVYSFSVFSGPLGAERGWTMAQVMTAFTINSAISPIPMILGGKLLDKGKAKISIIVGGAVFALGFMLTGMAQTTVQLYIAYGLLGGLGQGIAYSGTIGNTVKLFPDKRGLAAGLVTAGYGGATIITAPIANTLIEKFGILTTFKIMGIVYLVVILVAGIFIKTAPQGYMPEGWTPPAPAAGRKQARNFTWQEMIKTASFYIIAVMFMIGALSGMMVTSNASTIGQQMYGLTAAVAATYVSLYSFSNCIGRVFWGAISDKFGRNKALLCIYAVISAMLLLLITIKSVVAFAIAVVGIGLCFGGTMGIFPSLVGEKFGMKNYGVNYGVTFIGYSAAAYFGPKFAVKVATTNNGDFTGAFLIALVVSVVGIALTLIYKKVEKKESAISKIAA